MPAGNGPLQNYGQPNSEFWTNPFYSERVARILAHQKPGQYGYKFDDDDPNGHGGAAGGSDGAGGAGGSASGGAAGANDAFDADGTFTGPSTYTGAASGASWLDSLGGITGLAGRLAPLLAGITGGAEASRNANNLANQRQALAEADIFNTRMNAALRGPRMAAEDAARGDTQANIQPFAFTGGTHMVGNIPVPDATGGMGPQNLGPNARQAGRDLATQAVPRVTSHSFDLPTPPVLPPLDQAGTGTNVLNTASLLASLLAAFSGGTQNPANQNSGGRMPRTTL